MEPPIMRALLPIQTRVHLLTLACAAPPAVANASQPAAQAGACDGGPCKEQKPAAPREAVAPAAPAEPPATSNASPPAPPATVGASRVESTCDKDWFDGQSFI